MLATAVQQWNGLLKNNPNWPHKGHIPVNILNAESEKVRCDGDMTLFSFLTEPGVKRFTGTPQILYANVKGSFIVINDESLEVVRQKNNLSTLAEAKLGVVTHELGHLLGLGDSYERPGYLENAGNQPDATMNGRSQFLFPNNMSGDDSTGLNTLADHFFGGKPLACPEPYVTNTRASGPWAGRLLVCELKVGASPVAAPSPISVPSPTPTSVPQPPASTSQACTKENATGRILSSTAIKVTGDQSKDFDAQPFEEFCPTSEVKNGRTRLFFPNPPAGFAWADNAKVGYCNLPALNNCIQFNGGIAACTMRECKPK